MIELVLEGSTEIDPGILPSHSIFRIKHVWKLLPVTKDQTPLSRSAPRNILPVKPGDAHPASVCWTRWSWVGMGSGPSEQLVTPWAWKEFSALILQMQTSWQGCMPGKIDIWRIRPQVGMHEQVQGGSGGSIRHSSCHSLLPTCTKGCFIWNGIHEMC